MTRTTIEVGGTEVLDAFHDHDRDGDAVEVDVCGGATIGYSGEGGTIELEGRETDVEEYREGGYSEERMRIFEIRLNGDVVSKGLLNKRTHAGVTIEAGQSVMNIPPNQHVHIDVYGEEVED